MDDVDAGRQLADRVLHLEAGVQLDEVEGAVGADEELERARAAVADRAAGALGRRLHLLARLGRERGRGRLLDQLLVASLDRALALAEREHAALPVAEHLDLDVARKRDRLLDVEAPVAERSERLGGRGLERALELAGVVDEAHALAAAARGRLEQHGVAELAGEGHGLRHRGRTFGAGHDGHPRRLQLGLRLHLVAHALHHVGAGPDEDEVVLLARIDEGGVLGQEAVPGMDAVALGRLGRGDDRGDVEVAPRGRRRPDADGTVGQADVQGLLVRGRVDGHGLDAQLVGGADHADRDLAPVGDEDAPEHAR